MTCNSADHRLFVFVDPVANNNKFWEIELAPTGVTCKWGRIGGLGQSKTYAGEDRNKFNARIQKKLNENYKETSLVSNKFNQEDTKHKVTQAAVSQIAKGDSDLQALVLRLIQANRHDIIKATGGQVTFNEDGMARTALGIVTLSAITSARCILNAWLTPEGVPDLTSSAVLKEISEYLTYIPQKVSAKRGWHTDLFGTREKLEKQNDLLNKLETSVLQAYKDIEANKRERDKVASQPSHQEPIFEVKLKKVTDAREIRRIDSLYRKNLNSRHASSSLKIKTVYSLEIPTMAREFERDGRKVGGIREYWHGTRSFNVLSILKAGLVIPKSEPGSSYHITGRMFGDGLYFSDQSSKSLNYSMGYWDRSSNRDPSCFMFLADVAMGRAYTPRRAELTLPIGYDSMFAVGGKSGVLNNEMVVYRLGQANLKYLIEFSE
jgi:poly [ADP-ribose] polymerase 2/3/4